LTARVRSEPAASRLRLTFAALLLFSACVHFDVYRIDIVDTLYFGTAKADGGVVSDAQWQRFVTDVIAPRLEGFTTWDAEGLYRTNAGAVERERTHIVQIVHADGKHERDVAEIIAAYKKAFAQESVLRLRGRAGVAFQ
jgi:hypothetical protein